MAITFVSSTEFTYVSATPVTSRTDNINIGTRTKGALLVYANVVNGQSGGGDVTGITWNGNALSKAVETNAPPWSADLFYIFNPTSGANNLVTSFSGSGALTFHLIVFWVDSDEDLALVDTNFVTAGSGDPISINVDAGVSGAFCTSGYVTADNNVAAAGETLIQDHDFGGNCSGASYLITTGSGTQTLDWNRSSAGQSNPFNIAAAVFEEQVSGSPPTIALNTADDTTFNTATVELEATATDADGDAVTYEFDATDNYDAWVSGEVIKESLTSGSGTAIHPNPDSSATTWEGKIQVDDRVGQVIRGRGGRLERIHWNFSAHETVPTATNGQYVCRVYRAAGYPVGTIPNVWAASTAYSVGNEVRPTSTANADLHFIYRCTTAGTSGSTEPTWPLTGGNTVNDGSVVWETIVCAGPENPAAPEDTPTPGWIAQSTIYDYNPGVVDGGWKTLAFTGDNQIRLERDVLYCIILDWWPADRVTNNALNVSNASLTNATYAYGNVYLDGFHPTNNGPRIIDDAWFEVVETYILDNAVSDTDLGFENTVTPADTDPFNSGEKVAYTVQTTLSDGEYRWRARAKDPLGTNSWSDYATERTFTVSVQTTVSPFGVASAESFGSPTVSPQPVYITATGIASDESFGTPTISEVPSYQEILPTGIVSTEAFGSVAVSVGSVTVLPVAIESTEAFGTLVISVTSVTVLPNSIPSAELFGNATISASPVYVLPTSIGTAEAVSSPTVSVSPVTVFPTGIVGSEAFGSPVISVGSVSIQPGSITSEEIFGSPSVSPTGAVSVNPEGILSSEAFGVPVISAAGQIVVYPVSVGSSEAFGSPTLSLGSVSISPIGIISSEDFGTAVVSVGSITVYPNSIPTSEIFGTPVLSSAGQVVLYPSSITSSEVFGNPVVSPNGSVEVIPTGIVSAETFGLPTVSAEPVYVLPSSISSEEAIGVAQVSPAGSVSVLPVGIASAETFGVPVVISSGQVVVVPQSISSEEVFGTPVLSTSGQVVVYTESISSQETIGTPVLSVTSVAVLPNSIETGELFGTPSLSFSAVSVFPIAISTSEEFGVPEVSPNGSVEIAPVGIDSQEVFGTPVITSSGQVVVSPEGIVSSEVFGSAALSVSPVYVYPGSITSSEVFGNSTLIPQSTEIVVVGISSEENIGVPLITAGELVVVPIGVASGEVFGIPSVVASSVFVLPEGVVSGESIGIPMVSGVVHPEGIISSESIGSPIVIPTTTYITPIGIVSSEEFGNPVVSPDSVVIYVTGIASSETVPSPIVGVSAVALYPGSIAPLSSVGIPVITTGNVSIAPTGIVSAEVFGSTLVSLALDVSGMVLTVYAQSGITADVLTISSLESEVFL